MGRRRKGVGAVLRLTPEQQKNLALHVQYEIDEFRSAVQDLPSLRRRNSEWNRALESALLHFRILRSFFFGEGHHPNSDVFASHYVPTNWNPPKDHVFDATSERINQRLAHLTIERLKD